MKNYSLNFQMNLAPSTDLIYGTLNLCYPTGEIIPYVATSGCTGWQQPGDEWAIARGPLPGGDYEIPTTPYWLDTRGVEGWFFHISPDPVVGAGGSRSELGVHFDANVPGSAGCLVLRNKSGWERFCDRLAEIAKRGIQQIPLTVKYD